MNISITECIANYRPTHFKTYELVGPQMYAKYDENKLWSLMDSRVLWTMDRLREFLNCSVVCNTWYKADNSSRGYSVDANGFKERGLRDMGTSTGSELSQHKFGRASDTHFSNTTPIALRQKISEAGMLKDGKWRDNPTSDIHRVFRYVTCLEFSISGKPINWFHFDVGNRYNPTGGIIALHL